MSISPTALRHLKNIAAAESDEGISTLYARLIACAAKILDGDCPDLLKLLPEHIKVSEAALTSAMKDLSSPELAGLWQDPSSLGYAYQFFSHQKRRQAQDNIQTANKDLTVEKLIAFTQLYTPDWVVDFLLANTILDQWDQAERRCSTGTHSAWKYWIPGKSKRKKFPVSEITVLDPACGSGHFLIRAFFLLLELYLCEGYSKEDAIGKILANNLAGCDIDPVALWVCRLSLYLAARSMHGIAPTTDPQSFLASSHTGEDLLGSLSPSWITQMDHPLAKKYRVVITNPPYIGRKLLSRSLKEGLKREFPNSRSDLCTAFLEKGMDLLAEHGRLGMITQASLLFLPSYAKLRERLIADHSIHFAVEAGPGVFPLQGGEKVNSLLLVCGEEKASEKSKFIKLNSPDREKELQDACKDFVGRIISHDQKIFSTAPFHAINYAMPDIAIALAGNASTLADVADVKQGLATTDNKRFVRYWWEVDPASIGGAWVPYVKSGGSNRWYSPTNQVVNWADDGKEIKNAVAESYPYLRGKTAWVVKNESYYFRPGLCFSFVNSKELAVRILEPGCIFDVACSAVFPTGVEADFLLAYLNSSLAQAFALSINPTINFQVGDVKRIPYFALSQDTRARLAELARKAYTAKRRLTSFSSYGLGLSTPQEVRWLVDGMAPEKVFEMSNDMMRDSLVQIDHSEQEIDELVFESVARLADLGSGDRKDLREWVNRQISSRSGTSAEGIERPDFARILLFRLLHEVGISDISEETMSWIMAAMNTSLDKYFNSRFIKDAGSYFKKSPPFDLETAVQKIRRA